MPECGRSRFPTSRRSGEACTSLAGWWPKSAARDGANQATWAARSPRLQAQQASSNSQFGAAEELENLAQANRFFGWIADELKPHLGHRILEVGAGIGTIATKMSERKPASKITAIEPAENLFEQLESATARFRNVTALQLTSQELATTRPQQFDSIVYVNVLEHILDDAAEMRTAFALVAPGGSIGVFVPAMSRLYGSLDYKSGHHRRYDKARLREVIAGGGSRSSNCVTSRWPASCPTG